MTLSNHTLRSYDQQLEHLTRLIVDMGNELRELVLAARASFRSREISRVAEAKMVDKRINELDALIEEHATVILALQSPLAIDLRFVTSALKIAGMLESAGDLAKNTVKRSVKMGTYAPEPVIAKLEAMADIVAAMITAALCAFAEKDAGKAIDVWKRDQEVDDLYHEVFLIMLKDMATEPDNISACTHVVFAAKNMERIADYATDLARTVYYVNTGQRARKTVLKQNEESGGSAGA